MSVEFNESYLTAITQIDERSKSNSHRLDEAEADIRDLKEKNTTLIEMSASIKNLSEGIVDIKTDVKDIKMEQGALKDEVSDLKNAPDKARATWFKDISKLVITAIVTGVVAFVLGSCFPMIFT